MEIETSSIRKSGAERAREKELVAERRNRGAGTEYKKELHAHLLAGDGQLQNRFSLQYFGGDVRRGKKRKT